MNHKNKRARGSGGRGGCFCGGKWDKKVTGERPLQELRQADQEPPKKPRGRKSRARWCRGRESVEHAYEWRQEGSFPRKRCTACGRVSDVCFGGGYLPCRCGMHLGSEAGSLRALREWKRAAA